MREGDEIIGPEMEEQKPEPSVPLKEVEKLLKKLEKVWPRNNGLMVMNSGSSGLYLMTKHPEDGGKIVAHFDIPADGGDFSPSVS